MARKSNNHALNVMASNLNTDILDNKVEKSITYLTATTGKTGATTLATVTGVVAVSIIGVCDTALTGAGATLEVGTALSTAGLIAQTTGTDMAANEIWHDASPDSSIELTSVITKKICTQNIIQTIATHTVDTGAITYYIMWSPISSDGNVVIA